ncbi:hypothetical protein VNO77_39028 [Canavalia gladiata]|uniref:Uncharacterized protein n=1 Tax=Canavalia gladiata TaxID=3824 RepID=A0AAN9KCE1_CANGL
MDSTVGKNLDTLLKNWLEGSFLQNDTQGNSRVRIWECQEFSDPRIHRRSSHLLGLQVTLKLMGKLAPQGLLSHVKQHKLRGTRPLTSSFCLECIHDQRLDMVNSCYSGTDSTSNAAFSTRKEIGPNSFVGGPPLLAMGPLLSNPPSLVNLHSVAINLLRS